MGNDRLSLPVPNNVDTSHFAWSPPVVPLVAGQLIPGRSGLDWEYALRILQKNWRLSLVFASAVFVIVTIVTFRMKDIYEPAARVEIDPPGGELFSIKDLLNSQSNDQDYLQTQAQILQSDELIVAVIRTMGLDRNSDLVGTRAAAEASEEAPENAGTTQLTPLESLALSVFKSRLSVNQVRNSRLEEVSFASHDAQLAADVTNTLVNLFIDRNYRTRYETTMQASEWLEAQLTDLRQKVENSSKALLEYQRTHGIVDLGEKENTLAQKVAEVNHQLALIQADRIQAEAYLKLAEAGGWETLPQYRANWFLLGLTARLVETRSQLAQALVTYGKNHPAVKKLQVQVDQYNLSVNNERQKVLQELKTNYEAAVTREKLTLQAMDELRQVVGDTNGKMIRYSVLKNEAIANGQLYNNLLARLKEAGISAGLKSSNIRVVDPARVLDKPTRPHRLMNVALGLILGVVGGIGLAFLKEKFDNTIRTPDDIKALTGLSALAMFPLVPSRNGDERGLPISRKATKLLGVRNLDRGDLADRKLFLQQPKSPEAEAVQSLHTSIMLSRPGQPPRVMLVVSPSPGEGKTTVSLNLAGVLAQHGTTCLVDCDLRRPAVAPALGLSSQLGLSHVLTGSAQLESVLLNVATYTNLTILPAGLVPPNPGELIASEPMREVVRRLKEKFQFVVIDSPPVIPFADARALSPLTDGVIIVGLFGETTRQAITRANEMLAEVRAPVLGVVLNGVDIASPDYHYYHYGYTGRTKQGYEYGEVYDDSMNQDEEEL